MAVIPAAFTGFNVFGQFGNKQASRVHDFTEFGFNECVINSSTLIAASWSYTAFAQENRLFVCGFLTDKPNASVNIIAPDKIKQIAAAEKFCLILLENGKIYKLLAKVEANLEEVKFAATNVAPPQKRTIFGAIKQQTVETFTHIACGSNINVAVSNTNGIYSIPSKIHEFPKHIKVKQLVCGFEHAMLLTNMGDIYAWGMGLRGQLGQELLQTEETPVLLEALAGIKIIHIAAGGWHSAAISAFGDLYTWGHNTNGQLGLRVFKPNGQKEPTVFPLPQIIDMPPCNTCSVKSSDDGQEGEQYTECIAVKVYAGARHTIVQMNCGTVYAAGWNVHGQLGLKKLNQMCDHFERVPFFATIPNQLNTPNIVCGPWCTVAIR
ncbi:RCC1 domain-containing protein 1-like [Teleopsis dalmanni]|uniref:RCC1 domain-containing protein 1-like n=1 Tax=Teleopsis dalmanni TaxID=139649 RepID=UPI0018CE8F26|nr:RCC1 domain-containing protein 1-like [Teleopsis dalmanni]